MKNFFLTVILLCVLPSLGHSQNTQDFLQRYNRLVDRVGFAGVGVDNLLNNWYAADSLDLNVMVARFNYYFAKCQRDTVVIDSASKRLGKAPFMTLKDSLGRNVNYFKESIYDETLFGKALSHLDRAIAMDNTRLDLCILRANALLAYEKESPDLTLSYLKELSAKNYSGHCKWSYPGKEIDDAFFCELIQEYCFGFYSLSTTQGYEAFRSLSEVMMKYEPKCTHFVNNVGSYHFVGKGNGKKALKYYKKALKIDPEDPVAKKNISLIQKKLAAKK